MMCCLSTAAFVLIFFLFFLSGSYLRSSEYLNLNSPGFTGTLPQDICDLLVYIDDIIEVDCGGSLAEGCKCCGCDPEESY